MSGWHMEAFRQTEWHAASAAAERTRKLRRQQRLCDHFNGAGADEVTSSAPEPIVGFRDISIWYNQFWSLVKKIKFQLTKSCTPTA